jgi:hypothetical protein
LAIFLGLEDEKALEIGRICKNTATQKNAIGDSDV